MFDLGSKQWAGDDDQFLIPLQDGVLQMVFRPVPNSKAQATVLC